MRGRAGFVAQWLETPLTYWLNLRHRGRAGFVAQWLETPLTYWLNLPLHTYWLNLPLQTADLKLPNVDRFILRCA